MTTTRRDFLKRMGAGAVLLVGVRFVSGCEELTFESKAAGAPPSFLTPADDGAWYWQSGKGISKEDAPHIERDEWELSIRDDDGLVDTLDFDELQKYAQRGAASSYWKTMRCVFGQNHGAPSATYVANGIFTGIALHQVLEDFGLSAQAAKLHTFGADGFTSNIPMERALDRGSTLQPVMLAYELNGEPLSRLRGGPVRLVVPEMWGYKNVKWLEQLTATDSDAFFGTYETEQFGSADAQTQQIIDDPGEIALGSVVTDPAAVSTEVEGPQITLAGASVAGGRRIGGVELSLDDGPFEPAELLSEPEMLDALEPDQRELARRAAQAGDEWPWPGVWMTWRKRYADLSPGNHTVTIRASDASGEAQPVHSDEPLRRAPQVRIPFKII
ncbi:MAG: molybdopterin-dependent oxidoreductase [Persicimonas sp.]